MRAVDPIMFLAECRVRNVHANQLTMELREEIAGVVRRRCASRVQMDRHLDDVLRAQGIAPGQIDAGQFSRVAASQMSTFEKLEAVASIAKASVTVPLNQLEDAEFEVRRSHCRTCDRGFVLKSGSLACTVCGCAGRRRFENLKLRDRTYSCPHPKGPKFVGVP